MRDARLRAQTFPPCPMPALFPPAHTRPRAAHWHAALNTLAIFATALFACAALICLIAYNWEDLHRFARIALVACAFLAPCALAAVRGKTPPDALQQALYLAAMLAAGGLFALIGQIYQTGADTWQLFALWAALTLPLALIARTRLCWLLWFVLVDCALPGALEARFQLWEQDGRLLLLALAAFHALAAALFAAPGRWLAREDARIARWLLAAAMVLLFFAVPGSEFDVDYRIDYHIHSALLGAPTLVFFYAVMLWLYHRCRRTCRPLAALAAVLVLLHAAIRLADVLHDFLDDGFLLSLGLLAPCALLIFGTVCLRNDLYPATPEADKPAPADDDVKLQVTDAHSAAGARVGVVPPAAEPSQGGRSHVAFGSGSEKQSDALFSSAPLGGTEAERQSIALPAGVGSREAATWKRMTDRRSRAGVSVGVVPIWLRALQTLLAWVATAFLIAASVGLVAALIPDTRGWRDEIGGVLFALLGSFYAWGSLRLLVHARHFLRQCALPLYLAAHALLYAAVFFLLDDLFLRSNWQIFVCATFCAALAALLARRALAHSRTFAVLGGSAAVLWAQLALIFDEKPTFAFALLPLVLVLVLTWRWLREEAPGVLNDALALALAALTLVSLVGGFIVASDIGLRTDASTWPLAVGTAMLALAVVVLARMLSPHNRRVALGAALCAVAVWVCFCPPFSPAPAGLWLPLASAGLLAAPLLYLAAFAGGHRLWAGLWLALWPPHFALAYYSSHEVSLLARAAQFALLALVAGTAWAMNRAPQTPESTP